MIKYQYQTICVTFSSLDTTLNDKGNKGWRLVSITSIKQNVYECVFEKIIM